MDKIRETFIENEIMTAIIKMIDNPKENGAYLDHECTAEIVEISERYWNTELCDAHDALMTMRALIKAAVNNLKSRDEEIKKLKAIEKDAIRMDKNITKLQGIILSRDEEIEGYKSDIKARVELRAEDRRMLKINDEEINDRKLESIDYQETIIKQQAEIKKLTKGLSKIGNKLLFKDGCVDIMYIVEETLKGIT